MNKKQLKIRKAQRYTGEVLSLTLRVVIKDLSFGGWRDGWLSV